MKTIIFDWGGVLTVKSHTACIMDILKERYNAWDVDFFFELMQFLDKNMIDFDEFLRRLNEGLNLSITYEEAKEIMNKSIIHNAEMIELIKTLKEKYQLIILSNNNDITSKTLRNEYSDLLNLFDKVYFSNEVGLKKPDRDFFEYVIKDKNLVPEDSVFIDDKEKNVKASQSAGMKGILYTNFDKFIEDLRSIGIE